MVYEIVLKNGNELKCFTKAPIEELLNMMFNHDIFIVQENDQVKHVTYINPKEVSHFRFPSEKSTEPI